MKVKQNFKPSTHLHLHMKMVQYFGKKYAAKENNVRWYIEYQSKYQLSKYQHRISIFPIFHIITSITPLPLGNGSIVFGQHFWCRVFNLIFMLWGSLSPKKVVFRFRLSVCLRVYVWLCGEFLALYISKTNQDKNTKFYAQY